MSFQGNTLFPEKLKITNAVIKTTVNYSSSSLPYTSGSFKVGDVQTFTINDLTDPLGTFATNQPAWWSVLSGFYEQYYCYGFKFWAKYRNLQVSPIRLTHWLTHVADITTPISYVTDIPTLSVQPNCGYCTIGPVEAATGTCTFKKSVWIKNILPATSIYRLSAPTDGSVAPAVIAYLHVVPSCMASADTDMDFCWEMVMRFSFILSRGLQVPASYD